MVLPRTSREYYQFSFKVFALGQQDGRIGGASLTSPHRNNNFSSHPGTKVPLWELWVPGRRLRNPSRAAEEGCIEKAHQ